MAEDWSHRRRFAPTPTSDDDFTDALTTSSGASVSNYMDAIEPNWTSYYTPDNPVETLTTHDVAKVAAAENAAAIAVVSQPVTAPPYPVPGTSLGGAPQLASLQDRPSSTVTPEKRDSSSNSAVKVSMEETTETVALDKLPAGYQEAIMRQVRVAKPRQVGYFELFRFATRWELFLNALGILAAIIAGAAQPTMALLFGRLSQQFVSYYGDLYAGRDTTQAASNLFSQVALLSGILSGIGAGIALCTWAYSGFWVYNGERITRRVREAYLRSVLRQNIAYHDTIGAGEIATRIESDCHLIQEGISEKQPTIFFFLATFVAGFVIAFTANAKLAGAMTSILPAISITGFVWSKMTITVKAQQLEETGKGANVAEEVIASVRTVHAFALQHRLASIYDVYSHRATVLGQKLAIWHSGSMGIFMFVIYAGYGLAFYFGSKLIVDGDANAGDVVTVIFSVLIGAFSLAQVPPSIQAVAFARGACAKVYESISRVPSIDTASEAGLRLEKLDGRIEVQNVVFYYPSRPSVRVLNGISAVFPVGKTTALVGASGAGKSSIIGLVERFYDVIDGRITLDGHDIRDLNLRWLRGQIGLVSQEPVLFATSVAENIAHGLIGTKYEHASPEEVRKLVEAAAIEANADTFIRGLPEGYATFIGERGGLLSGGQKQRVSIARAIVGNPPILLLDEATSALDSNSEAIVQNALERAARGRTTIVIAHRLSTIRDADQIITMAKGEILEVGTHAELMAREGAYHSLVVNQRFTAQQNEDPAEEPTAPGLDPEKVTVDTPMSEKALDPLKRRETGRSVASAALSSKAHGFGQSGKSHSAVSLFVRMAQVNREDAWLLLIGLVGGLASGVVYPVYAIVFGSAIQYFSLPNPQQVRDNSDRTALYSFIISIVASIAHFGKDAAFFWSSERLGRKLRLGIFANTLRQDIEFFDEERHSTGALTAAIADWPAKILGLAGITLGVLVQAIGTIVAGMVVGLVYAPKLAAVGIALIPLTLTTGLVRLRVVMVKDKANKAAHEASAQMACEAAAAVRTVASLGREKDVLRLYSKLLDEPERVALKSAIWSNLVFGVSQAMIFFLLPIVFTYGSRLLVNDGLALDSFFTALTAVLFGSMQAGQMFSFAPDMSSAKSAASAYVDLADSDPLIDVRPEAAGAPAEGIKGAIQFKDVHFRYGARPHVPVLRGLNVSIKPGQLVALVGPSGCGKSTSIQLLERLYDVLSGSVEIDGKDIREYNLHSLRQQMALVSQEPTLYQGTLRDNVKLGAEREVTQDEVEQACRDANIHDFIVSLPDGYDTQAGSKGAQLSGGQKQRVAIARAILRNPKILVLDEATSALDSESERVVQRALDVAAKGRSTLAIAHRLTSIQHADQIYVINAGRVVEQGRHSELMALRQTYFDLVSQQALEQTA